MPNKQGEVPILHQMLLLLRCHILGTGCPNFTKLGGATIQADHTSQMNDFVGVLHYHESLNGCVYGGAVNFTNTVKMDTFNVWTPHQNRILKTDVADIASNTWTLLGVVNDRNINHVGKNAIWLIIAKGSPIDEMWAIAYSMNHEDANEEPSGDRTWDASLGTIRPIAAMIQLGKDGEFAGVPATNLVPFQGNGTPLGIHEDGWLMMGIRNQPGQDYMVFYDLSTGNLKDVSPTGLNRDDYSTALGSPLFADTGFNDVKAGIRSLVALHAPQNQFIRGEGLKAWQTPWSPLMIDDNRKTFYHCPIPCKYFNSPHIARHEGLMANEGREVVVLGADNIRNRRDSFVLKNSDVYSPMPVTSGIEFSQRAGMIWNPGQSGWTAYHNGTGGSGDALDLQSDYAGQVNIANLDGPTLLGFRNLILVEKDIVHDGVTLTDQTMFLAAGRTFYHIGDSYVPNGFKDGAPV